MIKSIDWDMVKLALLVVAAVVLLVLLATPLLASAVVIVLHVTGVVEVSDIWFGLCIGFLIGSMCGLPLFRRGDEK